MKELWKNLKFAWKYAKNQKKKLICYSFCHLASIVISIVVPILSAYIIVNLTNSKFRQLLLISLVIMGVEWFRNIVNYFARYFSQVIYRETFTILQTELGRVILNLENTCLDNNSSGVFIQRLTNDTSKIAEVFNVLNTYLTNIIINIGIFGAVFIINKVAFLYLIIMILTIYIIEKKRVVILNEEDKLFRKKNENVSGFVSELVRGVRDIKMLYAEEHDENLVNTAIMAAKSYVLDNKEVAPKYIGDSKGIFLKELKEKNYLKEDLKDSKGTSCIKDNSYVKVFKSDTKEYTYSAYLNCSGREIASEDNEVPTVNIFLTRNGEEVEAKDVSKEEAYDMSISKVRVLIFGDQNGKGQKQCDETLVNDEYGLVGYSIFIYKYIDIDKNEYVEIYNSGSLRANGRKCLTTEIDLAKYIDLTQKNQLKVVVRANNEKGGEVTERFDARFDDKRVQNVKLLIQFQKMSGVINILDL